ncbi:MAG: glycosyltransferase family 1 protein [Planctomycetaceae bacterium]
MRLAVISHKPCWPSAASPTGFASDGGFPLQMGALAGLFEETVLSLPCDARSARAGEIPLAGPRLRVHPLPALPQGGLRRRLATPFWLLRALPALAGAVRRADAVHAPVPGDVGTIGLLLAVLFRKPLFVRYCGNWMRPPRTLAERFWRWFMERFAGRRNVMLATGGADAPASRRNPEVGWIFSTSLSEEEMRACSEPRRTDRARAPALIAVGRMEAGKGAGTALDAFALLARRRPAASLDMVGDGSALPALKRRAEQLGVAGRTRFHGRVDHARVLALLRESDLLLHPTASEGFPKAVLEALACGLPVVTTPVSVLPSLLAGGAGRLVDDPTPERLAEAAEACLEDDAVYGEMSARARATAGLYTLERWRDAIGGRLAAAWGRNLR